MEPRRPGSPPSVQPVGGLERGAVVPTRRLVAAVADRPRRLVAVGAVVADPPRLLVEAVAVARTRPTTVEVVAFPLVAVLVLSRSTGEVVRRRLLLPLPLLVAGAAVEAVLPTSRAGIRLLVVTRH